MKNQDGVNGHWAGIFVQLSSFQMAARHIWLQGSCSWFPDAVRRRRCSESAEECLLCVHGRLCTLHNIHSPWQIYRGAEFLARGWNSLHHLSSAIVFFFFLRSKCSKILSGRISFPPPSLAERLNVSLLINYVKMLAGESWQRHQSSELCVVSAYTGA